MAVLEGGSLDAVTSTWSVREIVPRCLAIDSLEASTISPGVSPVLHRNDFP